MLFVKCCLMVHCNSLLLDGLQLQQGSFQQKAAICGLLNGGHVLTIKAVIAHSGLTPEHTILDFQLYVKAPFKKKKAFSISHTYIYQSSPPEYLNWFISLKMCCRKMYRTFLCLYYSYPHLGSCLPAFLWIFFFFRVFGFV